MMSLIRGTKWFVLLGCLGLTACGSAPANVFQPVGEAAVPASASKVSMLVATSRQPSQDPGTLFTGERSPILSLTTIDISIPPDSARESGTVQWPTKVPPNPEKEFAVIAVKRQTTDEARRWIRQGAARSGRVLVFVHGFNNRFADAVLRFAQIVHDSNADAVPILFTWPSRGSVFDYVYDKESANFSRVALERSLQVLASDRSVSDITVLAHSMGTWLTVEALRQMGIRNGRIPAKIKNVILASPDLDVNVFARQWAEMGDSHPRFTIFVSQDDKALAMSKLISGGVKRVGAINPAEEPYRSALEQAGITVIDLSNLRTGDRLSHAKFAESPEIVHLIGERLVAGQALTSTDVNLGEGISAVLLGTANTVGSIAATTVSAPVNVLQPRPQPARPAAVGEILQNQAEAKVPPGG